jgi:hypothetical protein
MESPGFNNINFESSSLPEGGSGSKKSKETETKSKKKESGESTGTPVKAPEMQKKEAVADKAKELLDRFFGDDKTEKAEKSTDAKEASEAEESVQYAETVDISDETVEPPAEIPEAFLETPMPEEEAEFVPQLAEHKIAELQAEATEGEAPAETAAREAAIAMLESIRDGEDIETAGVDVTDEMEERPESPEDEAAETADDTPEAGPAEFDDDEPIRLNGSSRPTGTGSSSGGRSGGGTPPPASAPAGATPPPPRPPRPVGPGLGPSPVPASAAKTGFNTAPISPAGAGSEYQPDYRTNPNATYLLVGGIVGYLIGRRRGRIKTEKRMNVVVQKLEKHVEAKQRELNRKTEALRAQVKANYESRFHAPATQPENVPSGPQRETASAQRGEKDAERLEGLVPLPMPMRAEQPVKISRERAPRTSPEIVRMASSERPRVERGTSDNRAERSKTVELDDHDVVRLSETITVGATNLKKIYEAKLVTRTGLRRLVNEHLQGKDIRRGLAREFLAKELSFERDPRFRDVLTDEGLNPARGGGTAAQASMPEQTASPAVELAAVAPSAEPRANRLEPTNQPTRKLSAVSTGLLTVLTIIAMALAAYAVLLGLTR